MVASRALMLLLLLSCSHKQADDSVDRTANFQVKEEKRYESEEEVELGQLMAGRLISFYKTHEDEKLRNYINEVGNYVASYSGFPQRRFVFEIIESEDANAFASPGGYILVTSGALKLAQSEAELAGILGHELAHVGFEHIYKTLKSMDEDQLEKVASERFAKLPDQMKVRRRPEPDNNPLVGFAAKYLSMAAPGLNVVQAARAGMTLVLEKGIGADLELEADRYGIRYASQAGYHPYGLKDYLCRLQIRRGGDPEKCSSPSSKDFEKTTLDKTHPPIERRVRVIEDELNSIEASSMVGAHGARRFLHYQRRLLAKK